MELDMYEQLWINIGDLAPKAKEDVWKILIQLGIVEEGDKMDDNFTIGCISMA